MRRRTLVLSLLSVLIVAGTVVPMAGAGAIVEPADETEGIESSPAGQGHVALATGGFHFTIPVGWNGGIFGNTLPIENRLTFNAKRDADGSVSGWYDYEQTFEGEVFKFSGPVTCLGLYDTPVLDQTPEVPGMTQNRAKWGGRVDRSTDPTFPAGTFIWFASMDNGEGSVGWSDASTLPAFGPESINIAFCNSTRVPNPRFGPHRIGGGNIQAH